MDNPFIPSQIRIVFGEDVVNYTLTMGDVYNHLNISREDFKNKLRHLLMKHRSYIKILEEIISKKDYEFLTLLAMKGLNILHEALINEKVLEYQQLVVDRNNYLKLDLSNFSVLPSKN